MVSYLTESVTIDNNIFGYEIITDQINLVFIPDHLIFHNLKGEQSEQVMNGILEKNYTLEIRETTINDNYLEYQIMLIEAIYDSFNNISSEIINVPETNFEDERNYYQRKVYYGRTNTLTFLSHQCHEYCSSCIKFGLSNNDQKCVTCKEEFSYFYQRDFTSNCVPENYYYDENENQLIMCSQENSIFYIDENNKKICFKNIKDCPSDYPFFNRDTNECSKNTISSNVNSSTIFSADEKAYNYMIDTLMNFNPDEEEKSLYLTTENFIAYEITTTKKEKNELKNNSLNDNLTIIDLGLCENILRGKYGINENISLILLKSENLNNNPS